MIQSINVIYEGLQFEVIVDGAGLDIISTGTTPTNDDGSRHDLFVAVVADYPSVGLAKALENAGAIINVKWSQLS